jgi:zinc finger SWIM domain-containing protein 3
VLEIDDNCRLLNVFWADARSREAYEFFGDVITFNTTYLTNIYDMPFSPFVGVNHHWLVYTFRDITNIKQEYRHIDVVV